MISDPPPLISILSVEPYQRVVGSPGNDVTSSWVLIGGNLACFFKLVIKFLSNLARHYFLLLPYVVGFTCFKPFHWLSVVNVSVGTCDINQYVCVCVCVCLRKIAHVWLSVRSRMYVFLWVCYIISMIRRLRTLCKYNNCVHQRVFSPNNTRLPSYAIFSGWPSTLASHLFTCDLLELQRAFLDCFRALTSFIYFYKLSWICFILINMSLADWYSQKSAKSSFNDW